MSGSGRFNAMTGMRVERSRFRLPPGMVAQDRRCRTIVGDCCRPAVFYPGTTDCFPMASVPGVVYATFNSALTAGSGVGRALAKAYPLCHSPLPWFLATTPNPLSLINYVSKPGYMGFDPFQVGLPQELFLRPWEHLNYWSTCCLWWGVFGLAGAEGPDAVEAEMRARWTRRVDRLLRTGYAQWSREVLGVESDDRFWFINDDNQPHYDPETGDPVLVITWDGVPTPGAPGPPPLDWYMDRFGVIHTYPAVRCGGLLAVAQLRFPNDFAEPTEISGVGHRFVGENAPWSRAYPGGYWQAGTGVAGFVEEPHFFARGTITTGSVLSTGRTEPATAAAVSGEPPAAPEPVWGRCNAGAAFPGRFLLKVEEADLDWLVDTGGMGSPFVRLVDTYLPTGGPYVFAARRSDWGRPSLRFQVTMERLRGAVSWTGEARLWGFPARATLELDRPYRATLDESGRLACRPSVQLSLTVGAPLYVTALGYACDEGYQLCPITVLRNLNRDLFGYMGYNAAFETQLLAWSGDPRWPSLGYPTVQTLTDSPFFWKVDPPDPTLVYQTDVYPVTGRRLPWYYDGLQMFPSLQVPIDGTFQQVHDPIKDITILVTGGAVVPVRFTVEAA